MNLKDLKRKSLKNYKPYVYGEQPDPNEKWIKLNTNENAYQPPQKVLDDIKTAVNERLRLYPDPLCKELRKLIIEKLFREYTTIINADNILVANGSDEILDILFKAFIDPGDRVITFSPSYGMYPVLTGLYNGELVELPLTGNFELPETSFSIQGKLMFINSPNNPTGISIPNEIIAKICESFQGLVVVDEAYANFSKYTCIPLLQKYKNLAVSRTFSKGFSFASERIGFIVADKEIIQIMVDVKLPYNVTYLSQIAAISALKNIEEYNKINESIIREREKMSKSLSLLGLKVSPSDANYILVKFPSDTKAKEVFNGLKKEKILVRTYEKKELSPYIRISIGKPEENDEVIKVIKRFCES